MRCLPTFNLIRSYGWGEWRRSPPSIASSHTSARYPQTKSVIHQSLPSAACLRGTSRTEAVRLHVCACQDFPGFISNRAKQMAHCDTEEWFYGALSRTVTNCDCRPPLDKDHVTDGLGVRAHKRTARQQSRCGEGVGRSGATVEERLMRYLEMSLWIIIRSASVQAHQTTKIPRNHHTSAISRCACAWGAFRANLFRILVKNPLAVKALHGKLRPSFPLDYNVTRRFLQYELSGTN